MKAEKKQKSLWKTSLILGILILILPGCLDIWITTNINRDGSISQIIVFQGDSTEITEVPFALMKEGDWKREWTKPEKDKYKLVVTKEFKSVKELNQTMNPADTNLQVVRINSTLSRKFRWFFTRYVYEQTALTANPFKELDYHNYLNEEEIRLLSKKEDDRKEDPGFDSIAFKDTEKRFDDFIYGGMFENFYRTLTSILSEDKSLTLTKQNLDTQKDLIYRYLIDSTKGETPGEILEGFGQVVNHSDIQTIRTKYLSRFDSFQQKLKFHEAASDDNYNFAVRMPGLLLQTNSPKIEAAETGWELSYYDFFFKDYRMTAESRVVNTWAFIVAGLILLVALVSLIVTLIRKR